MKTPISTKEMRAEQAEKALMNRIAATRYEHEVKGVIVDTLYIPTDDRSKVLVNGKWNRARLAEERNETTWTCRWKTPTGWVELDSPQMQAIGEAVDDYVQACFNREEELVIAVENGTFTEEMLEEGWPT